MRKRRILWVAMMVAISAGGVAAQEAGCRNTDDLKTHSDALKVIFDQFTTVGGAGAKGTPACYDWEKAYRAQLEIVRACARRLRESLEKPKPKAGPKAIFVVSGAAYGDLVNDDACNATPELRKLIKDQCEGDARAGYYEIDATHYYCTVDLYAATGSQALINDVDNIPDKMCGYKPSPYLKSSEQAFTIKFACAPPPKNGEPLVPDALALFRVPGQTRSITFACVKQADNTLLPLLAPGHPLDTSYKDQAPRHNGYSRDNRRAGRSLPDTRLAAAGATDATPAADAPDCTAGGACATAACRESDACKICKPNVDCKREVRCVGTQVCWKSMCDAPN